MSRGKTRFVGHIGGIVIPLPKSQGRLVNKIKTITNPCAYKYMEITFGCGIISME